MRVHSMINYCTASDKEGIGMLPRFATHSTRQQHQRPYPLSLESVRAQYAQYNIIMRVSTVCQIVRFTTL